MVRAHFHLYNGDSVCTPMPNLGIASLHHSPTRLVGKLLLLVYHAMDTNPSRTKCGEVLFEFEIAEWCIKIYIYFTELLVCRMPFQTKSYRVRIQYWYKLQWHSEKHFCPYRVQDSCSKLITLVLTAVSILSKIQLHGYRWAGQYRLPERFHATWHCSRCHKSYRTYACWCLKLKVQIICLL